VWLSEEIVHFVLYIIKRLFLCPKRRVFTARYGLRPYIKQICFVLKRLSLSS